MRPAFRPTTPPLALLALASLTSCRLPSAQYLPGPGRRTPAHPAAQTHIAAGMPLMQALAQRQTTRAFADKPLPLADPLQSALGGFRRQPAARRQAGLGRTAPSAMNSQDIELHVVLPQGVYVYDAEPNLLRPVVGGDLRGKINSQAAHAAMTIVYVAAVKDDWAQVDTGFIGQNVYLFAASVGLNAWFYSLHGQQDAAAVSTALSLPADKRALYAQSVGYPPQ